VNLHRFSFRAFFWSDRSCTKHSPNNVLRKRLWRGRCFGPANVWRISQDVHIPSYSPCPVCSSPSSSAALKGIAMPR
jgi:hypothetical protein